MAVAAVVEAAAVAVVEDVAVDVDEESVKLMQEYNFEFSIENFHF